MAKKKEYNANVVVDIPWAYKGSTPFQVYAKNKKEAKALITKAIVRSIKFKVKDLEENVE